LCEKILIHRVRAVVGIERLEQLIGSAARCAVMVVPAAMSLAGLSLLRAGTRKTDVLEKRR
jgi:hypothetical protein